jgi:L-lactate dehydrogenase complex protein LldG
MADSRDRILGRIRAGLDTTGDMLRRHAALHRPPFPRSPYVAVDDDASDVEIFTRELTSLFGSVHTCETAEQARSRVVSILADAGADRVIAWADDQLPVADLRATLQANGITVVDARVLGMPDRDARLAALDDVPACVTGADAAVAESGSIALVSGPVRGRLASLLPPLHIALLPAGRIVRTLPEALDLLALHFGSDIFRDRSNVVFVSGPSRTADIELSLTLGVHGPKKVHVVIFTETGAS